MDRPFIFKERSPVAAGDRAIMDLTHASRVPVDDGQVSLRNDYPGVKNYRQFLQFFRITERLKRPRQEITE